MDKIILSASPTELVAMLKKRIETPTKQGGRAKLIVSTQRLPIKRNPSGRKFPLVQLYPTAGKFDGTGFMVVSVTIGFGAYAESPLAFMWAVLQDFNQKPTIGAYRLQENADWSCLFNEDNTAYWQVELHTQWRCAIPFDKSELDLKNIWNSPKLRGE